MTDFTIKSYDFVLQLKETEENKKQLKQKKKKRKEKKSKSETKEQTRCLVGNQSSNYSNGTATPSGVGKFGCVQFDCF